jgi:hypothetical protein
LFEASSGWHALETAIYDPLSQGLQLKWRQPEFAQTTRVRYAGLTLEVPPDARCKGFAIKQGELRLETICRKDSARRSWCPIVIPLEVRLALGELPDQGDLPPEWWLAQLGSLPSATMPGTSGSKVVSQPRPEASGTFELSTRIRDLASRMRYASEAIQATDAGEETRIEAHLKLLEKIFDAHDPSTAQGADERIWRMWVRLELTQMLVPAAKASSVRRARKVAQAFRGRLSGDTGQHDLQQQWQALARVLP